MTIDPTKKPRGDYPFFSASEWQKREEELRARREESDKRMRDRAWPPPEDRYKEHRKGSWREFQEKKKLVAQANRPDDSGDKIGAAVDALVRRLSEETKQKLVRFIQEVHRSNTHPVSGRFLEPHEWSVLAAAAFACFPKTTRTTRRLPPSPGVVRMNWTVDKVLHGLLGVHENTRRGRELKRYLRDSGLQRIGADPYFPWRPDVTLTQIYRVALVEMTHRALRHEMRRPGGMYWHDAEWTIKYLHRAINGPADKLWQGEAWKIIRELADSSTSNLNRRLVKEYGEKIPTDTPYSEWMLRGGFKRGVNAPGETGTQSDDGWKRAWDEREKRERALKQAYAKHLEDRAKIPKKDYAPVDPEKYRPLPRNELLIEAEREHWKGEPGKSGTPIGFPCYNGPYMSEGGPYMGEDLLEFWDIERQAQREGKRRTPHLPTRQRHAILLRIAGYGYPEISQMLRISESTARTHVSEAEKRLLDLAGKGG